jgi:nucleotide-binding universal stress UspA family protein
LEAKGFVPNLERLLLAVDDSPNGQFASRLTGLIAGMQAMPTTVMHMPETKKTSAKASAEEADADAAGEAKKAAELAAQVVKEAAGKIKRRKSAADDAADGKLDVTAIAQASAEPEVVAEEAEKGYDLLVVGLERTTLRGSGFHPNLTQIAAGFDGPLAIVEARDGLRKEPLKSKLSILVPVNGTAPSRRAAEVAITLARATRAPVTALYVAPRANGARRRSREPVDAILKDIVTLAESYDVDVRTAVRDDLPADEAIVREMARRRHNLVVMGVGRRPGEKLFFGDTAAGVLEKSDRSIVFLAT